MCIQSDYSKPGLTFQLAAEGPDAIVIRQPDHRASHSDSVRGLITAMDRASHIMPATTYFLDGFLPWVASLRSDNGSGVWWFSVLKREWGLTGH